MTIYQYDALRYPERSAFSLRKLTTSSCAPGWMPHDLAIRRVRMPPPMAHPIPLADRRYACATVASRPPQFAIPRRYQFDHNRGSVRCETRSLCAAGIRAARSWSALARELNASPIIASWRSTAERNIRSPA